MPKPHKSSLSLDANSDKIDAWVNVTDMLHTCVLTALDHTSLYLTQRAFEMHAFIHYIIHLFISASEWVSHLGSFSDMSRKLISFDAKGINKALIYNLSIRSHVPIMLGHLFSSRQISLLNQEVLPSRSSCCPLGSVILMQPRSWTRLWSVLSRTTSSSWFSSTSSWRVVSNMPMAFELWCFRYANAKCCRLPSSELSGNFTTEMMKETEAA